MKKLTVEVARKPGTEDLPLPAYQSEHASGMDLVAAVDAPLAIAPGARALVPTGLFVAVPPGYEAQVRARSGLAVKSGLCVLNGPGTVDADYRGEVRVLLVNHGRRAFRVRRGDRVAQLVLAPVSRARWVEASRLSGTDRGAGGFGHSGRRGRRKR